MDDQILFKFIYMHLVNALLCNFDRHANQQCREITAVLKELEAKYDYLKEYGYRSKEKQFVLETLNIA